MNKLSAKKRKRINKSTNPIKDNNKNRHRGGFIKSNKSNKSKKSNNFDFSDKNKKENANEEFKSLILSDYNIEDYNNAKVENQETFSKSQEIKKAALAFEKEHIHIFGASSRKERRMDGKISKNSNISNISKISKISKIGKINKIEINPKHGNEVSQKNTLNSSNLKNKSFNSSNDNSESNYTIINHNQVEKKVKINSLLGKNVYNHICESLGDSKSQNPFNVKYDYLVKNKNKPNTFLTKIQQFQDLSKNQSVSNKIKFSINKSILKTIKENLNIENSKLLKLQRNTEEDEIFNEDVSEDFSNEKKLNKEIPAQKSKSEYEYDYNSFKDIKLSTLLKK